jgi:hypothetical protein
MGAYAYAPTGTTGTVSIKGLADGTYTLDLYSASGSDGQSRVADFTVMDPTQTLIGAVGPNKGSSTLTYGMNYLTFTPTVTDGTLNISFTAASSSDEADLNGFQLEQNASPAPEPSQVGMLALMGLGLGGLILKACKRQTMA